MQNVRVEVSQDFIQAAIGAKVVAIALVNIVNFNIITTNALPKIGKALEANNCMTIAR